MPIYTKYVSKVCYIQRRAPLGPFKKYVTGLEGRGVKQNIDKQWQGGKGVMPNSDVTADEKNLWQFSKLLIFCDKY